MIELIGKELYQWDSGRRFVSITNTEATKVHFSNPGDSKAPVVDIVDAKAPIPTYLLETGKPLRVYAVADGVTIEKREFHVTKRERPESYVYEDDQRNYIYELIQSAEEATAEAERVAGELRTARANGEFKGDPGVVKFVVVTELPEQDTENAIYLVPNTEQGEENLFDEYIFVDGKPEKIGSTSVGVNLDEYVKKTDVATVNGEAGLVKVSGLWYGLEINSTNNCLRLRAPTADKVVNRATFTMEAVTLGWFDRVLKASLTTNAETLTDEEKEAACTWLGVDALIDEKIRAIPQAEEVAF